MLKSISTRLRVRRVAELEGEGAAEAGFTLIELMVVLLIIAILLAIAIPTFLGVTGSANDRAAQSNLTNALTEVKALYQNNQSYNESTSTLPQATLQSSAPEFTWTQGAACTTTLGTNCVSEEPVDVAAGADGAGVVLANLSKTNTCWYVVDLEASPIAAFTDAGTGFTYQFASATTGTNAEESAAGTALTQAGVYYAKATVAASGTGTVTTCTATSPLTAGPWKWGTTYSNAATL